MASDSGFQYEYWSIPRERATDNQANSYSPASDHYQELASLKRTEFGETEHGESRLTSIWKQKEKIPGFLAVFHVTIVARYRITFVIDVAQSHAVHPIFLGDGLDHDFVTGFHITHGGTEFCDR